MKVEDILSKLISFNTIKDKENLLIMNYCKEYLEDLGFHCELGNNEKKYLYATIGKDPILGFVGHTDTVNFSNNWDTDPFTLTLKDNNIYGLGTSDMKGGIASFLYSVSKFNLKELKRGIVIVLTYDEECDFTGINDVLNDNRIMPEYLVIAEPTDNVPMNGSKGILEYRLNFYGTRTHSSTPIESSNKNCINFFSEILKLEDYFKESNCYDYDFPNSTINIGIIKGGDTINIVPDNTYATIDFRITNKIEELEYVKEYFDKISKKYNMKYDLTFEMNPFYNDSEIIKFYEEITGKKCKKFFGISEASALNGNRIIIGPGPVNAHKDNEFISKDSLYETVEIYNKIIDKFCK